MCSAQRILRDQRYETAPTFVESGAETHVARASDGGTPLALLVGARPLGESLARE